ncbi:tail fiber domain-containing protein [Runella sp.]|uniref:tail fiber domain-containing protein n=1 Tax=Runella sp. TaxID=1960881 RepID=UPI003D1082DC
MKTLFMLLSACGFAFSATAQILTEQDNNGSVTISPKGIKGSTTSATSNSNVVLGPDAFISNISGQSNTAVGQTSLYSNTTGNSNTALGASALYLNTSGNENTAFGNAAMFLNTTGKGNTATGFYTLSSNTTGNYNTATGQYSLPTNTTGIGNTAYGNNTLDINKTGSNNTAVGSYAGQNIRSGSNNTFLGYDTGAALLGDSSLTNAAALGYNAKVNASNKIRIGNDQITVIEGQVNWSVPSDGRLKENIVYSSQLGLNFISRLKPATYYYKTDKKKTSYNGFIAQDVAQAVTDLGGEFSGLKISNDGTYSIAYADFVMPLVNAVKELKGQNEELKAQNEKLNQRLTKLEELMSKITTSKTGSDK